MIADDAIEALKKIGHEAVANDIWESAGGIHNRASFLTTLQDMTVRKNTLKRRVHPTGKGYLYRLPEWDGRGPPDKPAAAKPAPVTRTELETAFSGFPKPRPDMNTESSKPNGETKAKPATDFEIEQGDKVPVLGLGSYVINTKIGAFLLEIHDGGARLRRIV